MPALSVFADGDRLDYVGPDDFAANPVGLWVKDGAVARLFVQVTADVADRLESSDTNTYIDPLNGTLNFVVDGNPVGNVTWDPGLGMPKWTLSGGLDPAYYAGTPQTLAQRNALVATNPLAKAGWLVYVVDTGVNQYQVWTGSAWVPVGAGASSVKVVEVLTIASRNSINNLASAPASPVEFHVNGVLARNGIANAGQTVTVNPAQLGFNIDPNIDTVVAVYDA